MMQKRTLTHAQFAKLKKTGMKGLPPPPKCVGEKKEGIYADANRMAKRAHQALKEAQQLQAANEATGEVEPKKVCCECTKPKLECEYPEEQWVAFTYTGKESQGVFVGICLHCFVKSQRRACFQCNARKDKEEYAINQWKKGLWAGCKFQGICKGCTTENAEKAKAAKDARKAAELARIQPGLLCPNISTYF